jgi:predicted outer membrane repeat protein
MPTNTPTAMATPTHTPASTLPPQSRQVDCAEDALREAVAAGGVLDLAQGCEYRLTADLPPVIFDTVISGNGAIIDGGRQYRIFYTESADITIEHLTIRNGYNGTGDGGGVSTHSGKIVILNSVLSGNLSQSGGGGIGSDVGDVVISHSELTDNEAIIGGGGIVIGNGHVTVTHSAFSGNSSIGCGAGILAHAGGVDIANSAFFDNRVQVHGGGGLCLASAEAIATITNSTFSGNSSQRGGGAIAAANGATVVIIASTLSDNVGGRGGGVWTDGTLILQQSIVAGNRASVGDDLVVERTGTAGFESLGYNLVRKDGGLELAPTDVVEASPGMVPLAGGVHTLDAGSPARDAIPAKECATSRDQRGTPRPQGAGCDIGAVEMPHSQ